MNRRFFTACLVITLTASLAAPVLAAEPQRTHPMAGFWSWILQSFSLDFGPGSDPNGATIPKAPAPASAAQKGRYRGEHRPE
jgi:hypothetical protein